MDTVWILLTSVFGFLSQSLLLYIDHGVAATVVGVVGEDKKNE